MKEGWNSKDSKLVLQDHITELGLTTYWSTLDSSFRFNASKHELFMAKQISIKDQKTQNQSRNNRSVVSASRAEVPKEDPMEKFFRRNREREYFHEDCHRGDRKDLHYWRRHDSFNRRCEPVGNNRFMLPRVNHYR